MSRRAMVAPGALVLCLASPVAGQTTPGWGLGGGAGYETYGFDRPARLGMKRLSLFTLPLAARIPLGAAALDVTTAYARGELQRPDGSSAALSGLTDTQLALSVPVGPVTLMAFGAAPTGTGRLTDAEAEVAGKIAADLLPFRISHWGSGGGLGVGSRVVHTFGSTSVGASAAYTVAREFDALEVDDFAYRPGNELRVQAGLDARVSRSGSFGLQAALQKSSSDQLNGQNLYQAGSRVHVVGSYAFAAGHRASGIVYGGMLHRSAGSYLTLERTAAAQDLVLAGAGLRVPISRGVLVPVSDLRVFRTADAVGQGWVTSTGASIEWPMGRGSLIVPTLRGRFGSYQVRQGETTGLKGFDLGLIVRHARTQ